MRLPVCRAACAARVRPAGPPWRSRSVTRATASTPSSCRGSSASSGAPSAGAAPGSACSSSKGWSRRTAVRSPCSGRPVAVPSSDLSCPPDCPTSGSAAGSGPAGHGVPRAAAGHRPGQPGRRRARAGQPHAPSLRMNRLGSADRQLTFMPQERQDPMSAPNKQYDPVEVAVLSPDEVAGMRDAALAAIAAAGSLDELKTARLAHAGDRSPLALANAEIGALPPQARAEAGKRVGAARREVAQALAARQEELEAERDQRALVEEAVDVTLPWDRVGQGA